jgi:hypothetical protein
VPRVMPPHPATSPHKRRGITAVHFVLRTEWDIPNDLAGQFGRKHTLRIALTRESSFTGIELSLTATDDISRTCSKKASGNTPLQPHLMQSLFERNRGEQNMAGKGTLGCGAVSLGTFVGAPQCECRASGRVKAFIRTEFPNTPSRSVMATHFLTRNRRTSRIPVINIEGVGGHPGMYPSTGITASTAPTIA